MLIFYLVGATISFVVMFGWSFAYWQGEYPRRTEKGKIDDYFSSFFLSLMVVPIWPVGLLMMSFITEKAKHGWRIK